jgi:hypothetical protein
MGPNIETGEPNPKFNETVGKLITATSKASGELKTILNIKRVAITPSASKV